MSRLFLIRHFVHILHYFFASLGPDPTYGSHLYVPFVFMHMKCGGYCITWTYHKSNSALTPKRSNKDKEPATGINSEDYTTAEQQTMRLGALARLTDSTVGQGHITMVHVPGERSCIAASISFICNKANTGTEKGVINSRQTEGTRHTTRQRGRMMVVYGCGASVSHSLSFAGCS